MRSGSPKHLGHGRELDTAGILLDEESVSGVMDFAAMFGNAAPVEIEIGTGKGTFLLARAAANPHLNFLGIEWARAYAIYAADRFRRAGLANVRMLRTDAGEIFRTHLAPQSLWRVHVYFPDPWPKARHHRRRLVQPPFVEHARRALKLGGQLIVVTDHRGYFEQIQSVLAHAAGWARVPMPRMADTSGELVGTNFERKYIAQGRPFYSAARMRIK